jgi:Flp pilus assembly pilin Flp
MVWYTLAAPWRKIERHRAGQGLVEYALIILLIALAVFVTLTVFGTQLASTYDRITASLAL